MKPGLKLLSAVLVILVLCISGCASSGSPSLKHNPSVLTSISLLASKSALTVGGTATLTAEGLDQYGAPFTITPTFHVSGTAVTVSGNTVTGAAVGSATVTASSGFVTSNSVSFSVAAAPPVLTSITLTASKSALSIGDAATLTAASVDQYGNPFTITPTFNLTGTAVTLSSNTVTGVAVGSASVTASSGSVTSNSVSFTVALVSQTITFGVAPSGIQVGNSFTVTASSTSGLSVTLASTTPAICSISQALAVGTCTIQATQTGNAQYAAATPVTQSFGVAIDPQTITFGALPNQVYGAAPITLGATASSGLPVSYSVTGPAALNGSVLKATGVGTVSVTASQAGNSTYAAATPVMQSFAVSPAALTVTADNKSMVYGQPIPSLTYTATGFVNGDTSASLSGTPAESTTAVSTSPVGTYPITIAQGSLTAANYTFVFANGMFTVTGGALQTITFGTLSNQIYGVAPIALTGTASSGLPVSYTVTGPATVSGSTLTVTGAGSVTVTASQSGNATYAAATPAVQNFVVATTPLTVTANNLSRAYGATNPTLTYAMTGFVNGDTQGTATTGAPTLSTTATATSAVGPYPITVVQGTLAAANYTFTLVNGTLTVGVTTQTITFPTLPSVQALSTLSPAATASSGLPVVFTSQTPSVCSITQALTSGTCTLEADQAGNADYSAAPSVTQSFTVTLVPQTITFPEPMPGQTFTVSATSSSNLPVTFSSPSTACTVNGTTVTEVSFGDCLIEANQAGNTIYAAAAPVSQDITIGQTVALISVTPSSITLPLPNGSDTTTFTATAYDQFNVLMVVQPIFTWTNANSSGIVAWANSTDANVNINVTASVGSVVSNPAVVIMSAAPPVLTMVILSSPSSVINAPGGTVNYTVGGKDQFSNPYTPVPTCAYSSSNLSAATISTTGTATAANTSTVVETTTITANCGSFTATATLNVNPPPFITAVTISGVTCSSCLPSAPVIFSTAAPASLAAPNVSLPMHNAALATVSATDEYTNPILIGAGQIVVDSVSPSTVAQVVPSTTAGVLSLGASAVGTATVTYHVGNVSATFTLSVTACPPTTCYTQDLTTINVTLETQSMEYNGTQIPTASGLDQYGASMTATYTWASTNTSILNILTPLTLPDTFTAIGLGSTTITASANGVTGTSAIIIITAAPYPDTPVITSIDPPFAVAKNYAAGTPLTGTDGLLPHSTYMVVNGTGFLSTTMNGMIYNPTVCFLSDCTVTQTIFKSSTKLVVAVPSVDLTTAGSVPVTVVNPTVPVYTAPATSAAMNFTVTAKGFVTITFDDGFQSGFASGTPAFNTASPSIPTTQFIITGDDCATRAGGGAAACGGSLTRHDGNPWGCLYNNAANSVVPYDSGACGQIGVGETDYITWANVDALAAAGNEIAPHTRSHNYLSYLYPSDLTNEVQGAYNDLLAHAAPAAAGTAGDTALGYKISNVTAYPYGDYGCYPSEPSTGFNSCVTGRFTSQQVGSDVKTMLLRGARTSDEGLDGGLKYNACAIAGDSCWNWADLPSFIHTIAGGGQNCSTLNNCRASSGLTCTFAGGTACDQGGSSGAWIDSTIASCQVKYTNLVAPGFQCWADMAAKDGTWVIFLFHRVNETTSPNNALSVSSTELTKLATYLNAQKISAVPFGTGLYIEGVNGQYEPVTTTVTTVPVLGTGTILSMPVGSLISYPSPTD